MIIGYILHMSSKIITECEKKLLVKEEVKDFKQKCRSVTDITAQL